MKTIDDILQERLMDSDRLGMIRLALTRAYERCDKDAIAKAAHAAQKYIDEGGDDYKYIDDELEDYRGYDAEKLTDMYILRLMRDRYCDDDADQEYIKTGWCEWLSQEVGTIRKAPVQLSFNF